MSTGIFGHYIMPAGQVGRLLHKGEILELPFEVWCPKVISSFNQFWDVGVDYVLPSENLNVVDSGVFWPARGEEGRKLLNDKRIGNGFGKAVSSDHRMTWIKTQF